MPDETSGFNIDAEEFSSAMQNDIPAYRLLHESTSGYARIFYCERGGRRFAVKCLRPEFASNPIYRELLRKEYDIGHQLYHHNIVAVNAIEDDAETGLGILMEYVDGITLRDYLAARPDLSLKEAEKIVGQIADALTYIHGHNLVHRDLKPSNILITHADNMVKIIDFGLSDGSAFTRFKLGGGTEDYAAPEQLEAVSETDSRADIYALGRIMLDFKLKNRAWNRVARRCLSVDPAKRPARAADILPAVRRAARREKAGYIGLALLIATILMLIYIPGSDKSPDMQQADTTTIVDRPIDSTLRQTSDTVVSQQPVVESRPVPEVQPAETPEENIATNIPLEEEAYQHLTEICRRHWQRHIATIDTMRNIATIRLATVGHWKYLAKVEYSRWLEKRISKNSPYFEQMMEMAAKTVEQFRSDNRADETEAWSRAYKRGIHEAIIDFTQNVGDNVYEHRTFQENGTWAIHSWNEAARAAIKEAKESRESRDPILDLLNGNR